MDVIRARVLGFCGGVRRAVTLIEGAAERHAPIYTLHAIVHNEHVMRRLVEKGVRLVDSLAQIPDGATVALTAHGAPTATIAALRLRELEILDATCPIVREAQDVVVANANAHRFSIVYGDREHLEVQGLLSRARGLATAAESLEGLEFPTEGRLAILAQTTKSPQALAVFAESIRGFLDPRTDVIVQDTTCAEPTARYTAARELAATVDAMVVVGSETSANTRNLFAACCESGHPAHFISSPDAIRPDELAGYARIGLTAGASTPDALIDDIEARLRRL